MKIKNIAAICKKNKSVVLFERRNDEGDVTLQYIGDGGAVYPAIGLPLLDEESVLAIFDVPEKQREDWYVRSTGIPEGINLDDIDGTEKPVERAQTYILKKGAFNNDSK